MLFLYSLPKKEASEASTEVGHKCVNVNKSTSFGNDRNGKIKKNVASINNFITQYFSSAGLRVTKFTVNVSALVDFS